MLVIMDSMLDSLDELLQPIYVPSAKDPDVLVDLFDLLGKPDENILYEPITKKRRRFAYLLEKTQFKYVTKVKCECGVSIIQARLKEHRKTQRHQLYLDTMRYIRNLK